MQTVRSFNTPNRTVYIGIQTVMKTEYEKDEERREELKYMAIQKSLGIILAVGGTATAFMFGEPIGLLLGFIGLALLITKQHALVI